MAKQCRKKLKSTTISASEFLNGRSFDCVPIEFDKSDDNVLNILIDEDVPVIGTLLKTDDRSYISEKSFTDILKLFQCYIPWKLAHHIWMAAYNSLREQGYDLPKVRSLDEFESIGDNIGDYISMMLEKENE